MLWIVSRTNTSGYGLLKHRSILIDRGRSSRPIGAALRRLSLPARVLRPPRLVGGEPIKAARSSRAARAISKWNR